MLAQEHLAKYKSMGVLAERIEGGYYRYELNGNKGLTKRAVLQGLVEDAIPEFCAALPAEV